MNHQEIVIIRHILHLDGAAQAGDGSLHVLHAPIDCGTIAFRPEFIQFPSGRETVGQRQHPLEIPLFIGHQYQRVGMLGIEE